MCVCKIYVIIIVKVRVKCSQTGKVFSMNLDELTKEDGEDVDYTAVHGDEVIYTDCRNGKSMMSKYGGKVNKSVIVLINYSTCS